MKRALLAILAAPLLLTACTNQPAEPTPQAAPESLDFDNETSLGIDVTDDQPSNLAAACNERPVQTTDGYVSLKNVELDGQEIFFYFAPNGSVYNSYVYNVHFDNGELIVRDASNDAFDVEYRTIPSTQWHSLEIGLSSTYYGQGFEIPAEVTNKLGDVTTASASINGEYAGTCKFG